MVCWIVGESAASIREKKSCTAVSSGACDEGRLAEDERGALVVRDGRGGDIKREYAIILTIRDKEALVYGIVGETLRSIKSCLCRDGDTACEILLAEDVRRRRRRDVVGSVKREDKDAVVAGIGYEEAVIYAIKGGSIHTRIRTKDLFLEKTLGDRPVVGSIFGVEDVAVVIVLTEFI